MNSQTSTYFIKSKCCHIMIYYDFIKKKVQFLSKYALKFISCLNLLKILFYLHLYNTNYVMHALVLCFNYSLCLIWYRLIKLYNVNSIVGNDCGHSFLFNKLFINWCLLLSLKKILENALFMTSQYITPVKVSSGNFLYRILIYVYSCIIKIFIFCDII